MRFDMRKSIFTCLFSIYNTISLSSDDGMMGEVSLET